VHAIVRHKVIDGFRRRGKREEIPIDDVIETLPAESQEPGPTAGELVDRYMSALKGKQYEVVKAITLEHASISQTATRLAMSEGTVRVTLHRAIAALARAYRKSLS
jgi:RNA polymerase sigma-70 factor (ECF subfamily)